jgi:hypothetical protein
LTAADYKAVRPTIPFILGMVKGKLSMKMMLAEALEIQSAERASGIEPVALEDPNQGDPNEELPGYFADGNEGGLGYGPDASITKVHKGTMYTEGEAYIVPQWQLRGVFYAHTKKNLLTDYFHLKIVKLCTTMPSSVDFSKIGKMFLKSLLYKECK